MFTNGDLRSASLREILNPTFKKKYPRTRIPLFLPILQKLINADHRKSQFCTNEQVTALLKSWNLKLSMKPWICHEFSVVLEWIQVRNENNVHWENCLCHTHDDLMLDWFSKLSVWKVLFIVLVGKFLTDFPLGAW